MDNEYELRYLPLFYEDMYEKVTYIRDKLLNPEAADDLINAVEKAIMERLPNCESFEPYHSVKEREYPNYRIYVKNFTVYYVVISDFVRWFSVELFTVFLFETFNHAHPIRHAQKIENQAFHFRMVDMGFPTRIT